MDLACAAALESKRGEFDRGGGSSELEQFAAIHGQVCRARKIGCLAGKKSLKSTRASELVCFCQATAVAPSAWIVY